jgi:hypothetical protein
VTSFALVDPKLSQLSVVLRAIFSPHGGHSFIYQLETIMGY